LFTKEKRKSHEGKKRRAIRMRKKRKVLWTLTDGKRTSASIEEPSSRHKKKP